MLDIVRQLNNKRKKVYVINLTQPKQSDQYDLFQNTSATVCKDICKDMLVNMTEWTEPHYQLNTERYLQRLVMLMNKGNVSLFFKNIIHYMNVKEFLKLSIELLKKEIIKSMSI